MFPWEQRGDVPGKNRAVQANPFSPTRFYPVSDNVDLATMRGKKELTCAHAIPAVIDQAGNKTGYETDQLPRIGERIMLEYGINKNSVAIHYFRVKAVMYRLQEEPDIQAAILIEEDPDAEHWPS